MHKTHTVNGPHGPTKGRFFWEYYELVDDDGESCRCCDIPAESGICFVPDYVIDERGQLKENAYWDDGWAELNGRAQPEVEGSHLFPDLEKPYRDDSIQAKKIEAFLKYFE